MDLVKENEAVALAIESLGSGYKELKLENFKDNPMKLVMGKLKQHQNGKYRVDILNNWYGIQGQAIVEDSALGIPIEATVENCCGVEVTAYGVVNWNADLNADTVEVYTDKGEKKVSYKNIKRIKFWGES